MVYDLAQRTNLQTWKTCDELWKGCEEAQRVYDEARKAYDEARKANLQAWKAWDKAQRACATELEALHAIECPGCPWDGERLVFPKFP